MQSKKSYFLSLILLCSLTRSVSADPFDELNALPLYGGISLSVDEQRQEGAPIETSWFRSILQNYYVSFLYYYCSVCSWVKRSDQKPESPSALRSTLRP